MTDERRSGCAVITGVFLIAAGTFALAYNLLGAASVLRFTMTAAVWYGRYWPILLIVWGIHKVLTRSRHPERSLVSGLEIVVLIWVVVAGLTLRGIERATTELSLDVPWSELAEIVGPDVLGPPHLFTETKSFDGAALRSLTVEGERGEVEVEGWNEERVAIVVTKRIHTISEEDAERIAASVHAEADTLGDHASVRIGREGSRRPILVDIGLKLPRSLAVTVRNSRGRVRVANLDGDVVVSTTYAGIEAENLGAGIEAETRHGAVQLRHVLGDAVVRSRHGGVTVEDVRGNIHATTRRAPITVEGIGGDTTLETRYGRVRVRSAGGDVRISGRYAKVDAEEIRGNVRIETSYRPIYVGSVSGAVDIVTKNASTVVRDVGGRVSIENRLREVQVTNVRGDVNVRSDKCAIDIVSVAGGIVVEGSHAEIRVVGLGSGLEVSARHAPVSVFTRHLEGDVVIETSYGDVDLSLPAELSARFRARVRDGELESEFPDILRTDDEDDPWSVWQGTSGSGRLRIDVETSYGDIVIRPVEKRRP